jgi:glycosyltransferase involved in cell wall biosynthesis
MTIWEYSAMLAIIMGSAKRRILFLITTSDWGGAQFFVLEAARAAKDAGHTVMVAAGGTGELETRSETRGIHFRHLDMMRRELSPLHDLAAIYELRRLIKEFKPDVVHLNSSKMGVVGSIAASLEHVSRIIYRIGGWSFLEDVSTWKRLVYLWSEKLTAAKKDVIVTVHPGDEEEAKRKGIRPKDRIVTIPNGIDLTQFDAEILSRDEARNTLGIEGEGIVVGTVANFYAPKNLPAYLTAVAPILTTQNLWLVLMGDGPQRSEIEKTIQRLGIEQRVLITGRRDDAAKLLRAFDLFVLPSSKEGMPWALLEAMAAGLPCIATDVGACRWMFEPDAGVIVPPNDEDAMRNAILSLAHDEQKRTALGSAARHAVESRFRWEDTIEKTLQLFL